MQTTYNSIKGETQADLILQDDLNARMVELTAALNKIQTERAELQP